MVASLAWLLLPGCGGGGRGGEAPVATIRFVNNSIEPEPLLFEFFGRPELLRPGEVGRPLEVVVTEPLFRRMSIVKADGDRLDADFTLRTGPQLVAFSGRPDMLVLPLRADPALGPARAAIGFGGATQRDNLDVYVLPPGATPDLPNRSIIQLRYSTAGSLQVQVGQTYQLVVTSVNQPEVVYFRTQSLRIDSAEPAGLITLPREASSRRTAILVATLSSERIIESDP